MKQNGDIDAGLNLISVGDADYERDAAHAMSRLRCVQTVKTVKFKESPTLDQLQQQLRKLSPGLSALVKSQESIDVNMDDWLDGFGWVPMGT